MSHQQESPAFRPPGISPQTLSALVDLAEDAIVAVDEDRTVVLFNRGAEKVYGYRPDEVVGRPLELLLPSRYADTHGADVDAFARSTEVSRVMGQRRRVFGRRKDGTEFPAEATIAKVQDAGRVFLTAIVRDVTERARAEAEVLNINRTLEERVQLRTAEIEDSNARLSAALDELRDKAELLQSTTQQLWQAAKLASVGELAASIAHELNNPLGTISLRLEAVLAALPADDRNRSALEVVDGEVERMARLVANLLQFSRPARDEVSTVDLTDEVSKSIELVHYHLRKRRVQTRTDIAPGLPLLQADRQKLRQLFLNLFSNAGDAMPDGGTLTVRAYPGDNIEGGAGVTIEVSDTGVGIPAELLPKVMEPFVTTKAVGQGTGLGLAICRRIVHEHRGRIAIESPPGAGTTIRITLPLSRTANVGEFGQ